MKSKKVPMRRCVGCMESKPKSQLLRIGYEDGHLVIDEESKVEGRGAYLCRSSECAEAAAKRRAFNRVFRTNIEQKDIEEIKQYLEN